MYAANTDRYGDVATGARQGEAKGRFDGNEFPRKTQGFFWGLKAAYERKRKFVSTKPI